MNIPIALPKASDAPLPELAAFLRPFAPLFRRSTTRRSLERYVTGLLTDLPRKNCETIAAAVAATSTERLQHLLTDATWQASALDEARVRHLSASSPGAGVLLLDETGLPKQGRASVGVARQYAGALGHVGNCQVLVSAEYVADVPTSQRPLHWPVSAQVYLPERWASDPARRTRAHVPAAVGFASKADLALVLLDRGRAWGVPFQTVVADSGYGDSTRFLAELEARQVAYVCGVARTFSVRLPAEVRQAAALPPPPGRTRGQRLRPLAPLHAAEAVLAALPEDAWQTVTWREGTKGPLRKQCVAVRAHWAIGNPRLRLSAAQTRTGPEGWLLGERPLPGEQGESKWYISNLPAETTLQRLVELAHSRWAIEQFYEDAKGECGLEDYQGRSWDGLHRHLALVMLTYSFLLMQSTPAPAAAGAGFPPLRTPDQLARRPSASAALAAPRLGAVVDRNQPDHDLSPSTNLTK